MYMVVIMIESLIGIVLFTAVIVSLTLKNPLTSVGDYPPAIQKKCIELGLIEDRKKRFTKADYIRKGIALIVFAALLAFIVRRFNGADSFWEGFCISYLIWLIIDWYDALILDCIWFCHSKKARIPGTEDMTEYKDYLFHIKQSCIGMLLGLPACLLVGLLVMIF
jgi:hypothetical protein